MKAVRKPTLAKAGASMPGRRNRKNYVGELSPILPVWRKRLDHPVVKKAVRIEVFAMKKISRLSDLLSQIRNKRELIVNSEDPQMQDFAIKELQKILESQSEFA